MVFAACLFLLNAVPDAVNGNGGFNAPDSLSSCVDSWDCSILLASNTQPRCSVCSSYSSELIRMDGGFVCPRCYGTRLQLCTRCKRPALKFYTSSQNRNERICKNCLDSVREKCAMCSNPLEGRVWVVTDKIKGNQVKYCDRCKSRSQHCFSCHLLTEPSLPKLPDGRSICKACSAALLKTREEYLGIFQLARSQMESMGLTINHNPEIRIVNLNQLKQLSDNTTESGLYRVVKSTRIDFLGNAVYKVESAEIFILEYLTTDLALKVAAHELGHAWYMERVNSNKGKKIEEGFAEWAAYHVLKKNNLNRFAAELTKDKSVYGQGLNMMLQIEARQGFQGVLRFVTQ